MTEDDPKGDTKIDKLGNLLGGMLLCRIFKAPAFKSPWRSNPEKQYMLSIDAARTSGFRDSLYYFRRNPTVVKLTLSQAEKEHLISLGRLSNNLKSRSVTMIAVRSAFKVHGSKMIKGEYVSLTCDGRWVTDDYYEDAAREDCTAKGITPGDPVGDLPDPNLYPMGDINQPIRTHAQQFAQGAANANTQNAYGSTGVYRTGGPTTHFGGAGLGPFDDRYYLSLSANTSMVGASTSGLGTTGGAARRSTLLREGVGEENWIWKVALMVHESNDQYGALRRSRLRGAALSLDPPPQREDSFGEAQLAVVDGGLEETIQAAREIDHFGETEMVDADPQIVQHLARKRQRLDGENVGLGMYEPHTDMFLYRADTQPTKARMEQVIGEPSILGGRRVGGLAWGVLKVDAVMETPT
ncbi:chromatin remodelling complex Rsc7/Swp82 subunit-domain-containing protein [Cantharellus anzutake]|uniref:chromatin remodelling complex Rsc7/Swp82 subunit-domain-containing protein n=1 Tax=Cantharellus anzutake TaxID=1750568 RepID=UPI001908638E|nr:chromatin remodelling complex Rsc7/Swp82 subunit-domain-containing protein [Cantharellus anzutake]KAF8337046.1 chromatin remodelling complex Rsc7/Swp82 subunit-domain-containing protein [Cantharellus anzutake]